MYYVIKFYKPTSADRKLTEKLPNKSALARWKRLLKRNGFEVDTITKITQQGETSHAN